MKSFSTFAIICGLALAAAACAPAASAQVSPVVMAKQTSQKPVWLKVEVLRCDQNSMTVRIPGQETRILTFNYAASAQAQVQKVLDKGGYQYGDVIKIRYIPGTSVALRIRGKASKPNTSPKPTKPTAPIRTHPASSLK
ncbi:MAG: hypothetical protein ACRD8A_09225 [Candidatus Acidiferrales bacterium]